MSAAALKEDTSSTTPVIENIPMTKPTTLTLRHTYKEGESKCGCTTLEACASQLREGRYGDNAYQNTCVFSVKHPSRHQLIYFERLPFGAVFVP